MAGQSPDPSFQPSGQEQARTQGRPAWQPDYPQAQPGQQPQPGQQYQQYQQPQQDYQTYPQQPGYRVNQASTRSAAEKGFFGSLFDFSFSSFVTPKLIRVLYALIVLWVTFSAIGITLFFYHFGGWGAAIPALIIVDPLFILLSLCTYRVILEAFMVLFRIYEETRKVRENTDPRS